MITKRNIYLDTSVFSAFFDFGKPVRQLITQKWFKQDSRKYKMFISSLVVQEISATKDDDLRNKLLTYLDSLSIIEIEITNNDINLATIYRRQALSKEINDTIHIACASRNKMEAIVSWNFKHIVNINTISQINQLNQKHGLQQIQILSPMNLGGDRYGNI